MKTLVNVLGLLVLMASFTSCGNNPKPKIDDFKFDDLSYDEMTYAKTGDEIAVPFREDGGVKYVPVRVNGMGLEMIFDTGCSYTLISKAEANCLYTKGMLTQDDYLGKSNSLIADGSIVENMVFNLKEVIIDGKIPFYNVTATVSNNEDAPLLLGNAVLNQVASVEIDNENKTLNFKIK